MKIIIDGESGKWEAYVDMQESGVYKKVELSECLRIEIRVPQPLTRWVSLVVRERSNVNSQPNDKG